MEFAILTNRKRALIALIHSVFFFFVAVSGFASRRPSLSLHGSAATAGIVLLSIYVTVTSVLLWLTSISRCARERIYFAFCATGASMGLLRIWFGDAALPVAQYMRVLMLLCAVITGTWIFRSFPQEIVSEEVQ